MLWCENTIRALWLSSHAVVHDWVFKDLGMSSRVCATVHIKDHIPLNVKSMACCPGGRFHPSFIHQVIVITGLNKLCSCPEDDFRFRQGLKPPLNLKIYTISHPWSQSASFSARCMPQNQDVWNTYIHWGVFITTGSVGSGAKFPTASWSGGGGGDIPLRPIKLVPDWLDTLLQGSQPLWKSGETLKMSFQYSSQGKLREFGGKNTQNQGKLREFVTVTQKGKVFASLGYVRLVPCVQVVFIDWLVSGFCEYNTSHRESIFHWILELSQGNIRENSGNFFFIKSWEPCVKYCRSDYTSCVY